MGERRTLMTGNTNTVLNTRQTNYFNTRNSITGLCERSVADHLNKIESGFIEKYLKYMVMDEFVGMFFKEAPYKQQIQDKKDIKNNNSIPHGKSIDNFQQQQQQQQYNGKQPNEAENVFYALRRFKASEFFEEVRLQLSQYSNVQELIIQNNGNKNKSSNDDNKGIEDDDSDVIESNEIVVIECGVKLTNAKMKLLVENKLMQLDRQLYISGTDTSSAQKIHLFLFYNGDINFDFNIPEYSKQRIYNLNSNNNSNNNKEKNIRVHLHVSYISKLALLHHFASKNRYHIDTIDDKLITFYELARYSHKSRQKQLHEQQLKISQEQASQQQQKQQKPNNAINNRRNQQQSTRQNEKLNNNPDQRNKKLNFRDRLRKSAENSLIFLKDRPMLSALLLSAGALSIVLLLKKLLKSKRQ